MNLPFFSKAKNQSEYYLGIFLKEEEGSLMLMEKKFGKMGIVEKENFTYTNGWENLSNDIDEILYRFEKRINKTVDKSIFFVYSHLVDDKIGDIKQPYLQKIKELVKDLELTALGYIECYEAVSKFITSREEIPMTGILVELDAHDLTIFIYKGGNVTHKKNVARTDNIAEDMAKALLDLKGKFLLPSKIILYNSHNLDSLVDKIISYRWDEQYFIQLPRVDILKEEDVTAGLVKVFAEQIGSKEIFAEEVKTDTKETFGFLINEDITQKVNDPQPYEPVIAEEKRHEDREFEPSAGPKTPPFKIPAINFKIPNLNFSFFSGKITLVVGLVFIALALFLNEYFFHKADLKVYMNADVIRTTDSFEISYTIASASASYTQSASTTGTRQIGDPAHGQVVVHNFDDGEKTFPKGTQIDSSGTKFAFDTDVKVASSSLASDGSAKLPGKNNVTVTAVSIGPEGNLAKGTRFTIADLPKGTYFAINESAFTGGSKRSVRTVSSADQDKLEEAILNAAKKQASLPKGASGSMISSLTKTTLTETSFSKEIGEEGNSVGLTAKARTTFYLYDKNELVDKILDKIKDKVKSGFTIDGSLVDYKISKTTLGDDGRVTVDASIDAKSVKKVTDDQILGQVVGRNKNALNRLKEKMDIKGYSLDIKEPIPVLKDFLPIFPKNINIIVTTL
ncbi:MAG: hypothetical protein ACOYUB_02680 [Patescibacteria group bacterium]